MGDVIASRQRAAVDHKLAELRSSYPALDPIQLRIRVWAVETSVFPFVAETSRADPNCIDRFFRGFWPRIAAELRADFPDQDDIQSQLDLEVERLVTAFRSDHLRLSPDDATKAVGRHIASLLDIPDGTRLASVWPPLAIEYGGKMVAVANLMNQLAR